MSSPNVEINSTSLGGWTSMVGGVNVAAGETVSVRLADSSGVKLWVLSAYGVDDVTTFPTLTQALTPTGTATFTAPGAASALIVQSRIGVNVIGKDLFDQTQSSFTTTFGVYVATSGGLRLGASNETTEGNAAVGWVGKLNDAVRFSGGGGGGVPVSRQVIAGAGLTGGGNLSADRTLNVVAGDGTIVVNADEIHVGTVPVAQVTGAVADTRQVIAGAGLTGGGTLASDRTLNVVAGDATIVVNADELHVGTVPVAQVTGAVVDTRQVIAGAGLTGGGTLASDRTLNVVAGDGTIVVNADELHVGTVPVAQVTGAALSARNLVAGAGLTGGGDLSADRTFNVVAGDATIVVNADEIHVGTIANANISDVASTKITGSISVAQHGAQTDGTLHAVVGAAAGFAPLISGASTTLVSKSGLAAVWQEMPGLGSMALGNYPTGGSIGSAATTVDIHQSFVVTQTTAGQTLTFPSPTDTTAGRFLTISAASGSVNFTTPGGATLSAGNGAIYRWDGSAWALVTSSTGAGGGGVSSVTAGAGLAGGGTGAVTVDVAAGDGSITVNANDITVGVISDTQHGARGGGTQHAAVGASAGFAPAISAANTVLSSTSGSAAVWTGVTENEPVNLVLKQVSRQDPFNVQPTGLLQFNDDMSVTTLTRFTQLSEGTPVTPTIASNLMTYNMSGGDKNNIEQEGSAITVPQFMTTVKISSVTHTGADTNTYENIGVGLCKDSNNFMFALWRRKEGTFGHVSIQVKIAGSSNFRGDITLGAAYTTPFEIGLSLVANSLTCWRKPSGGMWTKITSWALTEVDMKTTTLTSWKPALVVACQAAVQVSTNLTDFKFGSFGTVGFRDPVVFSNEDGSPYLVGNLVTLTATGTDPQAAAYCAVYTLDLVTYALTQIGVVFVDRGGSKQNDNAAHVIYYSDTSSKMWITSWGNTGAANIQVYYKANAIGTPDLRATGVYLIASMTLLTLPDIPSGGGTYDPYVVKISSTWYMAHTIGPSTAQTFFPALASSTDLSTWTSVGSDVYAFPFEGTRIVNLNGAYWVLAANISQTNVYDIAMNYVGIMRSPLTLPSGGYPPHPMLIPLGNYVYDVTFDNTLYSAVANTMGWLREFRARRYDFVFP